MLCHGFKGGTGTASRIIKGENFLAGDMQIEPTTYTVGALVQANYGAQRDLRIGGFPVGKVLLDEGITGYHPPLETSDLPPKELPREQQEASRLEEAAKLPPDGSIIIIVGTDAPLSPLCLQRLAKRAAVGLARVGGWGSNYSGDVFLAFSTGNKMPKQQGRKFNGPAVTPGQSFIEEASVNVLFEAAADAVEEAIYNVLCMAEETVGPLGWRATPLPLEKVREILHVYA